jgi:hypothetical protein
LQAVNFMQLQDAADVDACACGAGAQPEATEAPVSMALGFMKDIFGLVEQVSEMLGVDVEAELAAAAQDWPDIIFEACQRDVAPLWLTRVPSWLLPSWFRTHLYPELTSPA